MKLNAYKGLRCMVFLAVLGLLVSAVSFIAIPDQIVKEQTALYQEQEEDTIDIVYVGSSTTYQYYDVMTVWEEYGITSMCYASSALPFDLTIAMIELAQENQTPEVFVIDLRSVLLNEFNTKYYGMKETSAQKEAFINALNLLPNVLDKCGALASSNILEGEKYMHVFGILYYHDGFMEALQSSAENGFNISALEYKGNVRLSYEVDDLTDRDFDFSTREEDETYELTEDTKQSLLEVLEYCEENELNVYFTFTPYVGARNVEDENIRREIGEFITEYGYPFYDFKADFDEIGLVVTEDYYNKNHVNVLGAEKYTLYAMEYILDEYEIDPDYSQEVIDDWNMELEGWKLYYMQNIETLYGEIEEINKEL